MDRWIWWVCREKDSARVARDAHLHKALFLPGGLEDGTELGYYTQTKVLHLPLFMLQVPSCLDSGVNILVQCLLGT